MCACFYSFAFISYNTPKSRDAIFFKGVCCDALGISRVPKRRHGTKHCHLKPLTMNQVKLGSNLLETTQLKLDQAIIQNLLGIWGQLN